MSEKSSTPNPTVPPPTWAVHAALRAFSSQMSWHSHAVAAATGLHPTDLEILDLLDQHGDLAAGRLSELSGLTTGAITGVIDRLEAANHVERVRDPDDRRRVVVRKTAANNDQMREVYEPLALALDVLLERYTPSQLEAIADYADRAATVLANDAERLRRGYDDAHDDAGSGALAEIPDTATLHVTRGLSKAALFADPSANELVSGKFWRTTPTIRREGDVVTLAYRSSVFGSMVMGAKIGLHPSPRWRIDISGGVSHATLDLAVLAIRSISIEGGVRAATLVLPAPNGIVSVNIGGGVSELVISTPPDTNAVVAFTGGTNRTTVNAKPVGSRGSVTMGSAKSPDRYDIRISGGATKVAINATQRSAPSR